MTTATPYIAGSVSARTVRVSNTTLFHVAAQYLGDATLWTAIAALNGMTDPQIVGLTTLTVPQGTGLVSNGGILGL